MAVGVHLHTDREKVPTDCGRVRVTGLVSTLLAAHNECEIRILLLTSCKVKKTDTFVGINLPLRGIALKFGAHNGGIVNVYWSVF